MGAWYHFIVTIERAMTTYRQRLEYDALARRNRTRRI